MSLILDALRRAESQRQSRVEPAWSLPDGARRAPRDRSAALWASLGGGLLAAALLGTAVFLWQRPPAPPPDARAAGPGTAAPSTAAAGAGAPARAAAGMGADTGTAVAARRDVRSLAAEVRRGEAAGDALSGADPAPREDPRRTAAPPDARPDRVRTAAASRPAPGSVRIVAPGTETPVAPAEPAPAPSGARVAPGTVEIRDLLAEEGIPSSGSIALSGQGTPRPAPTGGAAGAANVTGGGAAVSVTGAGGAAGRMPPAGAGRSAGAATEDLEAAPQRFTLNMLSTSSNPANSYVYINMRRYRIGDETPEGAVIQDINDRGAVIAWRGSRFLLTLR